MKKLLLIAVLGALFSYAQAFNVTFQVDMTSQVGNFTVANINGTFNGWCGSCATMTDANADNIWDITIDLAAGTYEYKFTGDGWNIQENLVPGSSCTVTNSGFTNRVITVTEDTVVPVSCWGQCGCTTTYDVTFRVDMTNVVGTFTTPEVNGTFNGWCGACTQMTDANADNIWEVTVALLPGNYEYKFSADGWGIQETLVPGSACTVTNSGFTNRSLTVSADAVLDVVCYGACAACNAVTGPYDVTFQVDMSNNTDAYSVVNLNGTFNGWCGGCANMTDANGDDIWEITIPLNGGTYEYKFTADGWNFSETLAEGSSCTITTSGFTNRVFTVTENTTLPVVCYGSCSTCSPPTYDVTFRVDMNNVTAGFTTPEVNGTFNGWCGNCIQMTDVDADNIWEVTVPLAAGSYEYKFSADAWGIQENLPSGASCTVTNSGFTNRALNVTGNTVLDVVCWGSCSSCSAPTYNVTFVVDMNNVTDGFTTPEVNGTFNGWCGACAPMSDANGDNIWELTIPLSAGNYEYKFAADNWSIQETLTEGAACTVNGAPFVNRSLNVTGDVTLNTVCWGSCSTCAEPSYPITFRVDMNFVNSNFTTPEVNGTFNGWCGACAPMSDANGDNIWEITIPLQAGNYEYKFAADNWSIQESLTEGASCTVNGAPFVNRALNVSGPAVLNVVCWGECSSCTYATNDSRATAKLVTNASNYPACNSIYGNLSQCTPSSEALTVAPSGAGDDMWYRIVPTTGAIRVTCTSASSNIALELQNAAGTVLEASENETGMGGNEILIVDGLTVGATYYLAVRNFDAASSGSFTLCVQHFAVPMLTSPSTVNNLCSVLGQSWTGASSYTATFNDGVSDHAYSSSSTKKSLSLFGLTYDQVYTLTFTSVFNVVDAGGNPTTITTSSAPISYTVSSPPAMAVRSSDVCSSNSRPLNGFIAASSTVCGITGYEWEFVETDAGDALAGTPIYAMGTGTSRFMQLTNSKIPGIQPGDYYRVKVRTVFEGGSAPWPSSYQLVCITGTAPGMAEENNEEVAWVNADAAAVVYPNPNNGDMFNLNVNGLSDGVWNVQVLDVQGRIVHTEQVVAEGGINRTISLNSTLSNGLYTVRLINGEATLNVRMIVE